MAVYNNDSRGRQMAMLHIKRLMDDGYTRKDVEGKYVQLSKTVLTGKIAHAIEIVQFKHNARNKTIEVSQWHNVFNVQKAKDELYGFASPSIECRNAVKAGLFNEDDVAILREEFTEIEWSKRD